MNVKNGNLFTVEAGGEEGEEGEASSEPKKLKPPSFCVHQVQMDGNYSQGEARDSHTAVHRG